MTRSARGAALLSLILALPTARAGEPPTPQALWREALAAATTLTLSSANENGYRLLVMIGKGSTTGGVLGVPVAFMWSEIDTSKDEPVWTKPRKVTRRSGLPAQVVVMDAGVVWFERPRATAAPKKIPKQKPSSGAAWLGVTERKLEKGLLSCFTDPGALHKKGEPPVELCLAPGHGLVAVKGVVSQHADVIFAQPGWIEGD